MIENTLAPSWHSTAFEVRIQLETQKAKQRQSREELQRLKARLLQPILQQTKDPDLCQRFLLAANEALAAAWSKPRPFLLFPYLLEQKVREVQQWLRRQQRIRTMTQSLVDQWA